MTQVSLLLGDFDMSGFRTSMLPASSMDSLSARVGELGRGRPEWLSPECREGLSGGTRGRRADGWSLCWSIFDLMLRGDSPLPDADK